MTEYVYAGILSEDASKRLPQKTHMRNDRNPEHRLKRRIGFSPYYGGEERWRYPHIGLLGKTQD